jgi:predicted GIY-YIG superfamily endonuclease
MFVYVLELEDNKIYVGITAYTDRISSHFLSTASSWTKKYKPKSVIEIINDADKNIEKETTLTYMRRYGWENVRGAGWTGINIKCPLEFKSLQGHPLFIN